MVSRAMWLSLKDLLREKLPSDSILRAWLIRHAAWCLTRFQAKNDGRTAFVRVFGKAYTSQVLPFGERVMYKYTSVPTGNLDQRWDHGIWVGKAPMADEHIILTGNGVQKARSLHRVPPEERFVISELKKVRGFLWNWQGGKLESDDRDETGPRPNWTPTCLLDDLRSLRGMVQRVAALHRSLPSAIGKGHWPTREQILSKRQLDPSPSLPPIPKNQHRRHTRSQRLHHPILPRRCQHRTFRTSRWIHRWSWDHKNAENAKERGQARTDGMQSHRALSVDVVSKCSQEFDHSREENLRYEVRQFGAHTPNYSVTDCEFIERKLSSIGNSLHVYVKEENWEIVYRIV